MTEKIKIVVTCTTWKKRVMYAGRMFEKFLMEQTIKPDLFYCWLAEEEFPNKENDLPADFLEVVKRNNIILKWTKDNEYCFKRWYIYPEHLGDLVFSIDDDYNYPPNLIEVGVNNYKKYPNCILLLADLFYCNEYNNSAHKELHHFKSDIPSYNYTFCGQCVIPPYTFPMNGWNPDNQEFTNLRKSICKKCDESWFNPFLVYNCTKCIYLKEFGYNKTNGTEFQMDNPLWVEMNTDVYNGCNKRDIQSYIVLRVFNHLMDRWKNTFPGFNCEELNKLSLLDLVKMV